MTGEIYPIGLSRESDGTALVIEWSDGVRQVLPVALLRRACPCATCREKGLAQKKISAEGALPIIRTGAEAIQIASMQPAGRYAYHIVFSDGHSSGIFTLELLRVLGAEKSPP